MLIGSGRKIMGSRCRVSQKVLLVGCVVWMCGIPSKPVRAQITRNTVGPDGAFSTIQVALWNCPNSGECQVDVQAGQVYTENVAFLYDTGGKIVLTGGWNSAFTSREEASRLSTIDGAGAGPVLDIQNSGAHILEIEGFIIQNGSSTDGAGILVHPMGTSAATVKLVNLEIRNNHAEDTDICTGGGVHAEIDGSERLEIIRSEIGLNSATVSSGTNYVAGGGMYLLAGDDASFLVRDSWIEENTATSDTAQKIGAGQAFILVGDSTGEIENLRVTNNTASGANEGITGTGGDLRLEDNASLVVRRCMWALNSNATGGSSGEQLSVGTYGNTELLLTDSGMALGDQEGLKANAWDTSTQRFVNLTAADNTTVGINFYLRAAGATGSIYNSISYGNGTDANIDADVTTDNNLIGVDPFWVSPGDPFYNYRLDLGSPALDVGNNDPPPGGLLGTLDLDGRPRIENTTIDLGCYEGAGLLHLDGFESGGIGEWTLVVR